MNAIPMDLKRAIGIGIGLFLAIIGFVNGGVVVGARGPPITINRNLTTLRILDVRRRPGAAPSLVARKVRGGLLIGIVATHGLRDPLERDLG